MLDFFFLNNSDLIVAAGVLECELGLELYRWLYSSLPTLGGFLTASRDLPLASHQRGSCAVLHLCRY